MDLDTSKLHWRLLPAEGFDSVASDWDRLACQYGRAPFLISDFIRPMLRHFGSGRETLAVGEFNGAVIALVILTRAGTGRTNTFQPSQLPLGPVLLAPGLAVERVLDSLMRHLPVSTLVAGLTQLDAAMFPKPAETERLGVKDYIQTAWVDVTGTFAEYWDARGKNLRQNMRKQRRKLEEDGTVATLETLRQPSMVASAIADYGALESAGWKAGGGTAVHPDNAQGRFYSEMLERFCTHGRGCIYRYRFGDKVVAVDLCVESDDTIVILKTTYDETYKTLSPAFLMREEAFAQIWKEGRIRRIEFFGKLMDWHKRWTDNARDLYHVTRYRWGWIRRLNQRRAASAKAPAAEAPA